MDFLMECCPLIIKAFVIYHMLLGIRGVVVAIGRLDRTVESHFKCDKIDRISTLNNFEFNWNGSVVARRAFGIGQGLVRSTIFLQ